MNSPAAIMPVATAGDRWVAGSGTGARTNDAPVLDAGRRLPAVLPVVVYNGTTPWKAAREFADLVQPADPERLAEVGEWLVRCETAEEFLARAESVRGAGEERRN